MSQDFNFGFSGAFLNLEFTADYLSDGGVVYDFNFGIETDIYNILKGDNNHHTSIWCDPNASLTNGRFYVSTTNSLTIINNKNGQAVLEDYYSQSVPGGSTDTLKSNDVVDLVVAY